MKTLLIVMALSVATVFSAQAQTNKSLQKASDVKSVKSDPQQDVTKQARTLTEKMTRDLELTTEQSKQVLAQNKELYTEMADNKMKSMDDSDMHAMKNKSMDQYNSAMKRILKEDQYKKYISMKDTYMNYMDSPEMPGKDMDNDMDKDHMEK